MWFKAKDSPALWFKLYDLSSRLIRLLLQRNDCQFAPTCGTFDVTKRSLVLDQLLSQRLQHVVGLEFCCLAWLASRLQFRDDSVSLLHITLSLNQLNTNPTGIHTQQHSKEAAYSVPWEKKILHRQNQILCQCPSHHSISTRQLWNCNQCQQTDKICVPILSTKILH